MDREEMKRYLTEMGWVALWGENNWIDSNRDYGNPDWAGTTLEKAYQYVKENEHLYVDDFDNLEE